MMELLAKFFGPAIELIIRWFKSGYGVLGYMLTNVWFLAIGVLSIGKFFANMLITLVNLLLGYLGDIEGLRSQLGTDFSNPGTIILTVLANINYIVPLDEAVALGIVLLNLWIISVVISFLKGGIFALLGRATR